MNFKFIVNDYVLIWNLLFRGSISAKIHSLKQKLWMNYKNEYNMAFNDRDVILNDPKNYIPDDDTIYNIVLESSEYENIKKQTDKYRNEVLELWDLNKKNISFNLKNILRFDIKNYDVYIVNKELDVLDINNSKKNALVLGKKYCTTDANKLLSEIIFKIVTKEVGDYNSKYKEIVQAVLELAILNELATSLSGYSYYLSGDDSLSFLKRRIYPYWLMYLGVKKENMAKYMSRDKIAFDIDKYTFERQLAKVDLYQFIDFCIRNQKLILKIEEFEVF